MLVNNLDQAAEWLSSVTRLNWSRERVLDAILQVAVKASGTASSEATCATVRCTAMQAVSFHVVTDEGDRIQHIECTHELPLTIGMLQQIMDRGEACLSSLNALHSSGAWRTHVQSSPESLRISADNFRIDGEKLRALPDALAGLTTIPSVGFPLGGLDINQEPDNGALFVALGSFARAHDWPTASWREVVSAAISDLNSWDGSVLKTLAAGPASLKQTMTRQKNESSSCLTTKEIDDLFGHLAEFDLAKAMTDNAVWTQGAKVSKGTRGGRHKNLWNPVALAAALHERLPNSKRKSLSAIFERQPLLEPWRETWSQFGPDANQIGAP